MDLSIVLTRKDLNDLWGIYFKCKRLDLDTKKKMVMVSFLEPGSLSASNLQIGDIILSINGILLSSTENIKRISSILAQEKKITINVRRTDLEVNSRKITKTANTDSNVSVLTTSMESSLPNEVNIELSNTNAVSETSDEIRLKKQSTIEKTKLKRTYTIMGKRKEARQIKVQSIQVALASFSIYVDKYKQILNEDISTTGKELSVSLSQVIITLVNQDMQLLNQSHFKIENNLVVFNGLNHKKLIKGDILCQINNQALDKVNHEGINVVISILKQYHETVTLTVLRDLNKPLTYNFQKDFDEDLEDSSYYQRMDEKVDLNQISKSEKDMDERYRNIPHFHNLQFSKCLDISVYKEDEILGINLTGGNFTGLFVNKILEGSLAERSGIKIGYQLLSVNNLNFSKMKKEDATIFMVSLDTKEIEFKFFDWSNILKPPIEISGDDFYIRSNFENKSKSKEELNVCLGDIFHVRNSMNGCILGSYYADKIDPRTKNVICSGTIPNKIKGYEIKTSMENGIGVGNIKKSRVEMENNLNFKKLQKNNFIDNESFLSLEGYDEVVFSRANFFRPIFICGKHSHFIRETLAAQYNDLFVYNKSGISVLNIDFIEDAIEKNLHYLMIGSPLLVEYLNILRIPPIVININYSNNQIYKRFIENHSTFVDNRVKADIKFAARTEKSLCKAEHLYNGVFTITKENYDRFKWINRLVLLIKELQYSPTWITSVSGHLNFLFTEENEDKIKRLNTVIIRENQHITKLPISDQSISKRNFYKISNVILSDANHDYNGFEVIDVIKKKMNVYGGFLETYNLDFKIYFPIGSVTQPTNIFIKTFITREQIWGIVIGPSSMEINSHIEIGFPITCFTDSTERSNLRVMTSPTFDSLVYSWTDLGKLDDFEKKIEDEDNFLVEDNIKFLIMIKKLF